MKLRVLSVGCYLAHDDIANHNFKDAPAFFDFDVVVIDPECVSELWAGQTERQKGYDVIPWDSRTGGGTSTEASMLIRRGEMSRFLSSGRLLVCILRGPDFVYVRQYYDDTPDPKEEQRWLDRYSWLPLRTTGGLASCLQGGVGTTIKLIDASSIFSPYFKAFAEQLYFECYLERKDMIERAPGVEHFHEIALTHGGTPAAFSFDCIGGHVVFLPPAKTQDRKKLAGVLLQCVLASLDTIEESSPPPWVSDYKASLPNLSQLEEQVQELNAQLEAVTEERERTLQQKMERGKYLKLLYEKGKFQLEPVVRDAFSLFEFEVSQPAEGEFDALLNAPEGSAIVEVEGKDDERIKIDKYRQLLNYVVDDAGETGTPKKGILVGNAFRFKDPKERKEWFTQSVIDAATGSHYCLLTTEVLFDLVCQVLDNPADELKQEIRKRIIATDGLFNL